MKKVLRDGNVAVLISNGYGAGWYSWNTQYPQIIFHPKIVELVEAGKQSTIDEDWMKEHLGIKDIYCGGAADLKIHWLKQGTAFVIEEYDGAESLRTIDDLCLIA